MDIGSLPSSPLKHKNSKSKESRKKHEKTNLNQRGRDGENLGDNSDAGKEKDPPRTKAYSGQEKTTNINSNHSPSDKQSSEETSQSGSQKEVIFGHKIIHVIKITRSLNFVFFYQ